MLDTFSLGWVGGKMRKQNRGVIRQMAKIKMTIVNKLRATPHPVQSGQREIHRSLPFSCRHARPKLIGKKYCIVIRKKTNFSRIARINYYISRYIILNVTKPYVISR